MHADRQEEDRLRHAAQLSLTTQQMTPIIKEELRLSIMKKRHDSGQEEIKVEFPEPRSYELTANEKQKRERRREQNRRAARKCRQKKKHLQNGKQQVFTNIINQNSQLHAEVKTLRSEKRKLGDVLDTHLKSGCCRIPQELFLYQAAMKPETSSLSDVRAVYSDATSPHIPHEQRRDDGLPSFTDTFIEAVSPSTVDVDNDVFQFPPQTGMHSGNTLSSGNPWSISSDDLTHAGNNLPEAIFDAMDSTNDEVFYDICQLPDKMATETQEKVQDLPDDVAWMENVDIMTALCAVQHFVNPTSINEP